MQIYLHALTRLVQVHCFACCAQQTEPASPFKLQPFSLQITYIISALITFLPQSLNLHSFLIIQIEHQLTAHLNFHTN